ncbi:hypothetical protein GPECTOR_2g1107 [Gonium pectorale]|uniref:ABC transporter domain-containing protein n=1 Tax=Gonium pectorale TaxID=33097 RepID=A0A150H113_GONPE|nr:hypothetical protein GPECTOR_2g1107 [Gonium pectorale]|eukprot:KXZ55558.1 hypothetical protein GPECTOR_2g1107 [Gonium pectorale]
MRLRQPMLLVGQLLSAVALVGVIWLVDAAIKYSASGFGGQGEDRSPPARPVGPVPLCTSSPFLKVDAYLWDNPQTVLAAVHFRRRPQAPQPGIADDATAGPWALSFVVQSNASAVFFKGRFQDPNTYIAIPLQVAIESQVARLATGDPSLPWSVSIANFPHPSLATTSAVGRFAPTFLLAAVIINFIILLTNMVAERETGTRSALAAMGLRDSAHWVSWVVPEVLLTAAHSGVLLGSAVAMRIPLATRNSTALLFLLLWGSELAMGGVALVFSALLRRSASAVPAGFAAYIVSWALQLVVQFGFPYTPDAPAAWVGVFSALPPCLLTKGLQDMANAALGNGPGISWTHRTDYCRAELPPPAVRATLPYWQTDCVMPLSKILWLLIVQAAGYTALAAYLDGVLPREEGVGVQPPWAPLLALLPDRARLWSGERARQAGKTAAPRQPSVTVPASAVADVRPAADSAFAGDPLSLQASECAPGRGAPPIGAALAVLDANAAAEVAGAAAGPWSKLGAIGDKADNDGTADWRAGVVLFGLRPNGAGKTTTIKCLVGALKPSGGDALVCGHSVADAAGLEAARALTGICPQFDVLWGWLSGREHLALAADVKGLPWAARRAEVDRMLQQVRLDSAADRPAGSYSGGMRRRLSVAAALLGDPRVVSHVWELVSRVKQGRCMVLTTHSMEEAEVLGDRIAILAAGRLRCLGHSLALKRRYGGGYRVSVGLRALQAQAYGRSAGAGQGVAAHGLADDAGDRGAATDGTRLGGRSAAQSAEAAGGHEDEEYLDAAEYMSARSFAASSSGGGSPAFGAARGRPRAEPAGEPSGDGCRAFGSRERTDRNSSNSSEGKDGRDRDGGGGDGPEAPWADAEAVISALEELVEECLAASLGAAGAAYACVAKRGRSHVHFQVPRHCELQLPHLFERLEARGSALGVLDVQVKLSSLEDVYLEVIRQR